MSWLLSILVSFISGIAGLFLAGFIASACVSWYQISSREGASGYFVIFVGLLGGIAAFVIGLIVSRLIASNYGPGFVRELSAALLAVLLVAGFSALACRLLADIPPTIDGSELKLEVEFRFPDTFEAAEPPTLEGDWEFLFSSLSSHTRRVYRFGTIQTEKSRFENGHWIVPTQVEFFTTRGNLTATLSTRDAKDVMSFMLPIARSPGPESLTWSNWTPKQQANGQPWPSDKMSCRFRVVKVVVPGTEKPN